MILRELIHRTLPARMRNKASLSKHAYELNATGKIKISTDVLPVVSTDDLQALLHSPAIDDHWEESKKALSSFQIPDNSGGVNLGDRRAIYYLVSSFNPMSVLEIGTHIGASTIHIAAALYNASIKAGRNAAITSVDIVDVNSTEKKPWLTYGAKHSPKEMIDQLNFGSFVTFVTEPSFKYALNCREKFDFIFLDGSHAASIVYQEIPMALKLLNPNGIILLHDYFPGGKPLWSDGNVIPGPYLATKRLISEGADMKILPLGDLPWPTKRSSNTTSLALLTRQV